MSSTLPEIGDPVEELARIEKEIKRRRWTQDGDLWIRERLGDVTWSKQREILQAIIDHRKVLVKSCHAVGKSWLSSRIVAWWLDTVPPGHAFVVTSAPTASQIKAILWREIGRAFVKGKLNGRVNQTEWYMKVAGKEELVAFGRKPDDYDPAAFQGIHAPRVLVVLDEANGIRGPLHEAAGSLIANDDSKMLMIGNPDDPNGEYYEASFPGSGWHVVRISAFDSPNFTGEEVPAIVGKQLVGKTYVEEKRKKWAYNWTWTEDGKRCIPPPGHTEETDNECNPMWKSKILGLFPDKAEAGGLIPINWIKAAQLRDLSKESEKGVVELGVDVGGGGDPSEICLRKGDVYRIVHEDTNEDTMHLCGVVIDTLRAYKATIAKIDKIGIGWGIVNRGRELNQPFVGINVGEGASETDMDVEQQASDDRFVNLKAELYWNLRSLFESGLIDIDANDDDLAAELCSIRYERMSSGKIKILDKRRDSRGKVIASPNRAEALMLAAAPIREIKRYASEIDADWG